MREDYPHNPDGVFEWDWGTYAYNPDVFYARMMAEDWQLKAITGTIDWNHRVLNPGVGGSQISSAPDVGGGEN